MIALPLVCHLSLHPFVQFEKLLTHSRETQPEMIQPAKERKLDAINADELGTPNSFSPVPWLTCDNMKMTMIDKCIITSGDLLSDNILILLKFF